MKIRRWGTALAAALVSGAVLSGPAANAMLPPPDGGSSTSLRDATVARAQNALVSGRTYRLSIAGTTHTSTPNVADGWNYLGRNGSNANINQYTGYRAEEWCGDFAAAMWTGVNKPNPATFPRIPDSYPSSQAWMTQTGSAFHRFSVSMLPARGDVLVWTNDDASSGGHVGVVAAVNTSTKMVTTIEGNQLDGTGHHDSIVRFTRKWDSDGPTISGKHFRGFTSRQ